jgi:hypothetical protein
MPDRSIRPVPIRRAATEGALPTQESVTKPANPATGPGATDRKKKRRSLLAYFGLSGHSAVSPAIEYHALASGSAAPAPGSLAGQFRATPASMFAAPAASAEIPPQLLFNRTPVGTRAAPPRPAQDQAHLQPRPMRDAPALASAIRRHLPLLAAEERQRYTQMLHHIEESTEGSKHLDLMRMLAGSVIAAVRREQVYAGTSPTWQALLRITVGMRFQKIVTQLSERREAELLGLRAQILKLPAEMAAQYDMRLWAILASTDMRKRNLMLRQISQQVAARLARM